MLNRTQVEEEEEEAEQGFFFFFFYLGSVQVVCGHWCSLELVLSLQQINLISVWVTCQKKGLCHDTHPSRSRVKSQETTKLTLFLFLLSSILLSSTTKTHTHTHTTTHTCCDCESVTRARDLGVGETTR